MRREREREEREKKKKKKMMKKMMMMIMTGSVESARIATVTEIASETAAVIAVTVTESELFRKRVLEVINDFHTTCTNKFDSLPGAHVRATARGTAAATDATVAVTVIATVTAE